MTDDRNSRVRQVSPAAASRASKGIASRQRIRRMQKTVKVGLETINPALTRCAADYLKRGTADVAAKVSGNQSPQSGALLTLAGCQQPGPSPATTGSTPPSFTAYFLLELSWRRTFPPSYR